MADKGRSPMPRVIVAALALAGLAGLRHWVLSREPSPAPPSDVRIDDGVYVQRVAPMLRRAGCATAACHGSGAGGLSIAPGFTDSAGVVAELTAVRARVRPGDPAASVLWRRAVDAPHTQGRALRPGSCEASMLSRWINGRAVAECPAAGSTR